MALSYQEGCGEPKVFKSFLFQLCFHLYGEKYSVALSQLTSGSIREEVKLCELQGAKNDFLMTQAYIIN